MRLSVMPSIAVLVAAIAFLFAYMCTGVAVLPVVFNMIGVAACALLVVSTTGIAARALRSAPRQRETTCATKVIPHTERRVRSGL